MVQEESDLIEQYIASLSEKEKKAYLIAKEHLASSFDIEKSNGFLRFCAAKITEKVYTDEHSKWDKPPRAVCLLIDLSVTLPLNI